MCDTYKFIYLLVSSACVYEIIKCPLNSNTLYCWYVVMAISHCHLMVEVILLEGFIKGWVSHKLMVCQE